MTGSGRATTGTARWSALADRCLPERSEAHALPLEYLLAALRLAVGWHFLAMASAAGSGVLVVLTAVVGGALALGVAMRPAAVAGIGLVLLQGGVLADPHALLAVDPVTDLVLLVLLVASGSADVVGLGRVWADTALVQRLPWLA